MNLKPLFVRSLATILFLTYANDTLGQVQDRESVNVGVALEDPAELTMENTSAMTEVYFAAKTYEMTAEKDENLKLANQLIPHFADKSLRQKKQYNHLGLDLDPELTERIYQNGVENFLGLIDKSLSEKRRKELCDRVGLPGEYSDIDAVYGSFKLKPKTTYTSTPLELRTLE
ncbi:MAG: hypothetical protein ACLFTH_02495 [Candidatus Woesearchaeota archaeon]